MKKSFSLLVLVLMLVLNLSACGGGGGGGGSASYSVGGTVSGLSGTVVLQNNGADDLTITADGAFTFASKVADGGAYSVTVLTQPVGQTCTASSNTGTIAGADVTNVSVVCSTNAYSVGGTVTGLDSGKTVVLQNNGADDLTITSNGGFTFGTAVADGAGYQVSVKTHPTGLTCTASNNTGTISGANITNVFVVCAATTYSVGGTASNLLGAGLVLLNNGVDDLAVPASSTSFTFASRAADGAGYLVTIKTQPANQVCTVANGAGTIAGANVTNVSITCVTASFGAKYSAAPDWNDYVKAVDTATACDGTETGGYSACIHGGEMRMLQVPGKTTCGSLTASDALGAFDWTCDASTNPVRMVSTGLKDGKNLSDLIDFTAAAWKANPVTVYDGAAAYLTTGSSAWWSNPMQVDNDGMTSGEMNVAGTIYLVNADATGTYAMGADKIALVIKPGVTLQGTVATGETIISANTNNFLWLEGAVDATGDNFGVYLSTVKFSVLKNLNADNANVGAQMYGVYLESSSNNSLANVSADYNGAYGIYLAASSNNSLTNISAGNNGTRGVALAFSSSSNTLSGIAAANNGTMGVALDNSYNNSLNDIYASNNAINGVNITNASSKNTLSGVTAVNNGSYGVSLSGSSNNRLTDISAANNGGCGVYLFSSSRNNVLTNVSAAGNATYGVSIATTSTNNVLSNISAANNGSDGINIVGSNNIFISNFTAANNGAGGLSINTANNGVYSNISTAHTGTGVYLATSSDNIFTGLLKVGSNGSACSVSGGTNPGLVTGTCANQGSSDAALTMGIALGTSFTGKVTSDAVQSNTIGTADYASITDWVNFNNQYRAWGKDNSAFPNADNQGRCTTGTCRIWDWSLASGDSVIRNVLSLPTGTNTHTHVWYAASLPFNQGDCDTKAPGSVFNVNKCENTFLMNAIEIAGDGIGNDNFLCESNETCLFTPNIGSYQGHGNLVSAGAFTNGTITGVTLMKYANNGR